MLVVVVQWNYFYIFTPDKFMKAMLLTDICNFKHIAMEIVLDIHTLHFIIIIS